VSARRSRAGIASDPLREPPPARALHA